MFDGAGRVFQNCYVVDDLDKAIEHWIKTIGAGPFFVNRKLDNLEIEYRGKPSGIDIDFALGQAGPIHIELIQDNSKNPTVYNDMYPKGSGGGFHHVGMLAKDFEAAVSAYEDAGCERGMIGMFGSTPFAYMDTRSSVGFFTEFHHDTAEIRALFDGVEAASKDWNGERPVRPMSELLEGPRDPANAR
ncbi:VOC family protein [Novosphingobium sp. 9U]|uniref:VOC family protein n=1 Tax=Novosphingobium sp. 9U TaxID=2653158 RepID=UPI0012F2180B|nr:VOC family protein [Novosphingobium sp. 9U]VWX50009.1 Glyoxalase/Bleomycin resistance protein/Dioxygenase superfamily protein [Novosphingobium sp. 9U]